MTTFLGVVKRIGKNFLFAVPVTVAFCDSIGYVARVEGTSMQPALNPGDPPGNDYVLLNKWAIRKFEVKTGDIVALTSPKEPSHKLIKRVIATEGCSVKPQKSSERVTIPPGHCWVEGDHRYHSLDSNFFGPVCVGLVFAKASYIVWPPSRWRRLGP